MFRPTLRKCFCITGLLTFSLVCIYVQFVRNYSELKAFEFTQKAAKSTKESNKLLSSSAIPSQNLFTTPSPERHLRVERVRQVCKYDQGLKWRRTAAQMKYSSNSTDHECTYTTCPIVENKEHGLLLCFIPKVASTKLKEFFLNLSNIHYDRRSMSRGRLHMFSYLNLKMVPPSYALALPNNKEFLKILFVRHPFERLLSVYRDKVENFQPVERSYWLDEVFNTPLMKNHSKKAIVDQSSTLTFPEFVWFLTHTFEEDVNHHFTPYSMYCDPCLVDYNFIGKLETSAQDFPYIFQKAGIQSSPWLEDVRHLNLSESMKYWSQIPNEKIFQLYSMYKQDFDMFGYSIDEYITTPKNV